MIEFRGSDKMETSHFDRGRRKKPDKTKQTNQQLQEYLSLLRKPTATSPNCSSRNKRSITTVEMHKNQMAIKQIQKNQHDSNHYRTALKLKTKNRVTLLHYLTIIVLLSCATPFQTNSDKRSSLLVEAQTSLLSSPLYLSSSSAASLSAPSIQAGISSLPDNSAPSSILKRDLSAIRQVQQRNVCQVNDGESVAIVEIEESRGSDMSQLTNPLELPISGSVNRGEIELRIESETHKYFQIQDKRLKLTRPLDRDAVLKENSTQIQQHPISSIYLQISCLDKRDSVQSGQANRKVIIPVLVKVLDLNDNAPKFTAPVYTIQVDELTPVGSIVADQIQALDLDSANNGLIEYSLLLPPGQLRGPEASLLTPAHLSHGTPSRLVQRAQPEQASRPLRSSVEDSSLVSAGPASSTAPSLGVLSSLSSSGESNEDFHTTTAASSAGSGELPVTQRNAPTINMNSEPILNGPMEDSDEEESDEALLASLNATLDAEPTETSASVLPPGGPFPVRRKKRLAASGAELVGSTADNRDWSLAPTSSGAKLADLWTNLMALGPNSTGDDLMLADRPQLAGLEYKLTSAAPAHREPDGDSGEYFALEMTPSSNRPVIRLKRALDFEARRVHVVGVVATDRASNKQERLASSALLVVKVTDGDDQPPAFVLDQQGCATGSVPQPTPAAPTISPLDEEPAPLLAAPMRKRRADTEPDSPMRAPFGHNLPKGFKVTEENFDFSDASSGNTDDLFLAHPALSQLLGASVATTRSPIQPIQRQSTTNADWIYRKSTMSSGSLTTATKSHYADYSCLSAGTPPTTLGQAEYFAQVMSGDSDYLLRIGPQAIKARDRDSLNAPIRYTFVNGTPTNFSHYFQINPLDASIKQIAPVERQQVDRFAVLVQAEEQTVNRLASFARLVIDVIPSDKNPPVLVPNGYGGFVEENAAFGASVMVFDRSGNATVPMRIAVIDADHLQQMSSPQMSKPTNLYEFETTSDAFKVNKDGFVLVNRSPLDRDPPSQALHMFQVTARQLGSSSSRSLSSPVSINVTLIDLNDNPPVLANSSLVPVQLSANSGQSQVAPARLVTTIRATDKDLAENSRMAFSILHVSNNGRERFRIDDTSGRLEALGKFTAGEQFSLTIKVSDELGRFAQGILEVLVVPGPNAGGPQFIVDTGSGDNNPSAFLRANDNSRGYAIEINENAAPHSAVLQVRAADPENDPISYSIIDGNINNDFTINSKTGLIQVNNKLDREEVSGYNLLVQARDSGGLATNRPVKITIQDNNDQNPVFQQSQYVFSVEENVAINTLVGKVLASDADAGDNGLISYLLLSESASSGSEQPEAEAEEKRLFVIDERSGEIRLLGALDYERAKSHTLLVTAKDHGETPRSTTTSVMVRVIDKQDEAPYFERYHIEARVLENLAQQRLGQVQARDPDSVAQVTYVIKSGDTSLFAVDPQSGIVSTLRGLDFEQARSHTLFVGTVEHQEPDLVEAASALAEALATGHQLNRSPVCRLDVTVLDVNDNVPHFVSQPMPVRIQDSAQLGTQVIRLTAQDRDGSEPNNQMRYELAASTGNSAINHLESAQQTSTSTSDRCLSAFMIDATSGVVTLKADLKRDSQSECTLLVRVRDLGQQPASLSSVISVTIFIDHIAEISPANSIGFADTLFTVELEENSPVNSLVKVLPIVNKPKVNFPMSCEIISGNELAKFYVIENEQRDCELRTRNDQQANIDYELKQRYTLIVRLNTIGNTIANGASSPAHQSAIKTVAQVNVNILDKNDNRPVFHQPARYSHLTQGRFLAAIAYDAPSDTQLIQVRATDLDSANSNGLVSYELLNDLELDNRFKVDPIDGIVRTSRPVEDVLSSRLPLRLKLMARDNPEQAGSALDSLAELVVNLIDERHRFALVLKDATTGRALDSKEELLSTLQERTGLISGLEKAESLKIQRNGTIEPDVSGTDFWFYLIEPGTFRIVSNEDARVRASLLEQRAQNSLADIIGQTLGFAKARVRLPYSMSGSRGRSASASSARGTLAQADHLASVLILIALFIAIISAIVVVYQCGFLSSYARSARDKSLYLQRQQQQQQHSPGSSYFPGLSTCAVKSAQHNGLTMSSQQQLALDFRSPFSTLPSAHQIAPNSMLNMSAQRNATLLMNPVKQLPGDNLPGNIYQLEPTQQANNANNANAGANAALCKEYETQMLKMSVLFDDSNSLDDQNLNENNISRNHLA